MMSRVAAETAASIKKTNQAKSPQDKEATGKKRKATKASTGVEKLKKVNTDGMAKMSSFFKKK